MKLLSSMMNLLKRYWNFTFLGIPKAFLTICKVLFLSVYERISSFFWKYNLKDCGNGVRIQKGTTIRFPKQVELSNGVKIGRNCQFSSEFEDSNMEIAENSHVNKKCLIDYSGGLFIGKNVTVSEGTMIETHSHGYDPRSKPEKMSLIIEDNVWIGARVTILPNTNRIGENSIIGSGSIVTKDIIANTIVAGIPAEIIKRLYVDLGG